MMGSGGATHKTNMMSATPGLDFMETATRKGDDSKKDGGDNHMRSSALSKKS